MKSIVVLLLLLSLILTPSVTLAQEEPPYFEEAICPIEVPDNQEIECGYLITLEDVDNREGRTIRLPIIIIHSSGPNVENEALLFTEGGPGFSSLQSVWWLASSEFANHRDIVILEQRGNILAEPSLNCDILWSDETPTETPCLDSLYQRGIELKFYSTASIAADINALKQALNYELWDLYGTSYSTRPVQLVMKQYPEKIRSVVLQSLSPLTDTRYQHDPEHTARALQKMFDDCRADPDCAEAYPDLETKFYALIRELNHKPVSFTFVSSDGENSFTYEVNGTTLISWMDSSAFKDPAYPPHETSYLPLLIDQASQGYSDVLYTFAKQYIAKWDEDRFAWGLYYAINCQDDAPHISVDMIEKQVAAYPELDGYYRHRSELTLCDAWVLDSAPSLAEEPVVSDIPVLILAGAYDSITPPEWSRTAIVNMKNSTFVEFPSLGHSVLGNSACAQSIMANFLENPAAEPEISCVKDEPVTRFVLPSDLILAPSMYEIQYGAMGYSLLEQNLFVGSLLTLMGAGIFSASYLLVNFLRKRRQAAQQIAIRITPFLLCILAITCLVWGLALRWALRSVSSFSATTLCFGLPGKFWWLFAIAIGIGLLTVTLLVITILSWINNAWSPVGRVTLSMSTIAAVVFSGLLGKWGLFTAFFR